MKASAGDKYGRWTVVAPSPRRRGGRCLCRCECGVERMVADFDLIKGKSKECRSCGSKKSWSNTDTSRYCRYPDVPQEVYTKIIGAVDNAIARCTDKKHKRYHDWGGRGIKVMFATRDLFIEHLISLPGHNDMSLVLDRINNDRHYEAGNLRFVSRSESQLNRRNQGGAHEYYLSHGYARCFKKLHDIGLSFKEIGRIYEAQQATVRNCVRELETTK